jgi:putative oxidoreductase
MKTLQRILRLDFMPANIDLGLLLLRVWLGLSMLVLHGWGKLTRFQEMAGKFSDPLGIGSKASLSLAVFGETVAPALIILGLFTRFGALVSMTTMAVAFSFNTRVCSRDPAAANWRSFTWQASRSF